LNFPLAYEYRKYVKNRFSNFFSGDVFNYVTNWMTSPVYLRQTESSSLQRTIFSCNERFLVDVGCTLGLFYVYQCYWTEVTAFHELSSTSVRYTPVTSLPFYLKYFPWNNTFFNLPDLSLLFSRTCRLGGVVVSVIATWPKGRGFEPGEGNGFLRAIKIRSTPSFGSEVKPKVPCHKILRHVKDLLKSHGDGQTKFSFPSPILLLTPEMSLLTGPPDSTGSSQSALVDKLGVSPSLYHHTMVHIANHPGWTVGQ
jgi:hypothetical protein